jgi:hypothetical protein
VPTLFEQLQSRLANQQAPAPQAQQAGLTKLLKSQTGKAGATAPAQSNLAEQAQIAQAQTQAQAQQAQGAQVAAQLGEQQAGIAQQAQLAKEQLAGQKTQTEADLAAKARTQRGELATTEQLATEQRDAQSYMKLNQLTQKYDQFLQKAATDRQVTQDKLFGSYNREQAKLDLEKKGSRLNQDLFALTLSNKKYIDEISKVGDLRRAGNTQNFQKELQDVMFGNEFKRLQEEYSFLRDLDVDTRKYSEALASLGADAQIQIAESLARANQNSLVFGTISKGAEAYGSYDKSQKSKTNKQS